MSTSLAAQHSEWLSLVEISGPFLTLPVLKRALPLGLDRTPLSLVDELRVAWSEVSDDDSLVPRWIRWVLHDLLALPDEVVKEGTEIGPALTYTVPEHGVRLRPDFAIVDPDAPGGGRPARMLITTLPAGTKLDERLTESKWSADAVDRMAELCRGTGVRLGLVTNGNLWAVVDAPVGGATGVATWDAGLWLEERLTLDAFTTLLGVRRFFSVADSDTLDAMLSESANAEAEVTDQLGKQVRAAVELLVDAMSRANRDRGGHLFDDLSTTDVYEAAVTVMMRLVFLLSAEERGLFLLGDETYDSTYAVSTLRAQLEEEANTYGEEVIARQTDAWHRLLATFRMVFAGAQHENLRLLAYGGSLFDPDRFPFLEGRKPGESWRSTTSNPLPIDNRTVLHILGALQVLTFTDRRGVKEARRLSFRALDVEQIGHVYEGLLDHSAVRNDEVALGLIGKNEPEIALELIELEATQGQNHLVTYLGAVAGLSTKAVEHALTVEPAAHDLDRLTSACDNDQTVAARIAPYLGLLRFDLARLPVVYMPDSMYVTLSSDRRSSGTYYTPRVLAEEIVQHTLQPLVYSPGPAEGAEPANWKLKSSEELLDLKVCDMAMGSGAFLVATCRYLSARLLEAWQIEEADAGHPAPIPGGGSVTLPVEDSDREILARRLVADSCLYGVDRNPMAVEMAKLALWLVTLAKDRPFSFLDHALRVGDSLLGVTSLAQLEYFHLESADGAKLHGGTLFDPTVVTKPLVENAIRKRRELESFLVLDVMDANDKRRLFEEARADLELPMVVGDVLIGAAVSTATETRDALESRLVATAPDIRAALAPTQRLDDQAARIQDLRSSADYWLDEGRPPKAPARQCLHWPLEFPEVFLDPDRPGFDAVIGNPPFLGGVALARIFGEPYERFLKNLVPESNGFVDLAVYFHRRAQELRGTNGIVTLLGPQNLVNTANRAASTDAILTSERQIGWARRNVSWPGTASVHVCAISYVPSSWPVRPMLDGRRVNAISASLDADSDLSSANRLRPWIQYSEGTHLYGASFVKTEAEWQAFIQQEPDLLLYLRPYINADILCSMPESRRDLFVVDFGERKKEELTTVSAAVSYLEETVGRERSSQTRQIHEKRSWLHWDKRLTAYERARLRPQVMVCPTVSKHLPMLMVDSSVLFTKAIKFFPDANYDTFALLQSGLFLAWAFATSPLREDRIGFSTRNSLDTFPPPESFADLQSIGLELCTNRAISMKALSIGITDLLNLFHAIKNDQPEIATLRQSQVAVDLAVAAAYGWQDLVLDHDFWETRQGIRFTVSPDARVELLDRLLELNHARYAEEVRSGVRSRKNSPTAEPKAARRRSSSTPAMFEVDP
jgi:hypothetical protein